MDLDLFEFIMKTFLYLLWITVCTVFSENCNWMNNSTQVAQALPDTVQCCLSELGKYQNISDEEATGIWEALVEARGGAELVPDLELRSLGWILKSVPAYHMANFSMLEIETISTFGVYRNLSDEQLKTLAFKVLEDWGSKRPSDYTSYDLETLQHILCGFNASDIQTIHPDAYKEAAPALATIHGCSRSAIKALALLATTEGAFRPTSTWTSAQTKHVGCLMNGLEPNELTAIPPYGWDALSPDIVICLLPETLQILTEAQLLQWTPSAVKALSSNQRSHLSDSQRQALDSAFRVKIPSSAANLKSKFVFISSLALQCYHLFLRNYIQS